MKILDQIKKPTKKEQRIASDSFDVLSPIIDHINIDEVEIKIEETKDKIKIPLSALKFLGEILKSMSEGKAFSIVPVATEVTTQKAADILGCSRPHLVKLLEEGAIAYNKVGKHRRIKYEDIIQYQKQMKERQRQHIIQMMQSDEEAGLYDS